MIERKRPNLGGDRGRKAESSEGEKEKKVGGNGPLLGQKAARHKKAPQEEPEKGQQPDGDEEDDDILKKAKDSRAGGEFNKIIFAVMGVVVVVAVVVIFLLLSGGRSSDDTAAPVGDTAQTEQTDQFDQSGGATVPTVEDTAPELTDAEIGAQLGVGTQDFSGDTNMQTDATITDAEQYTKDIYGLTTRVDYSVDKILDVTDFVEYKKYRGTWGGGLELYWLSATYKGAKYVIQVPFKYYKELDEVGIVPVKMEVLTIEGEGEGDDRTIISYMCLDEETLESVMKTQAKATGK